MRVLVVLSLLTLMVCGCTPRSGQSPAVPAASVAGQNAAVMETTLCGNVVYRERMALPEDCDVWVQLIEVDAHGRTLSVLSDSIETATKPGIPLPFSLTYVPALITPEGRYALLARILYQGETLFATPTPMPLQMPTAGPIDVLTRRFVPDTKGDASAEPDPASLIGHRWQLYSLYGVKTEIFDNQPAPHIVFHPEAGEGTYGSLSGSDGCNLISATYELTEEGLDIRESAVTMRMCPSGMEQARAFAVALEETDNWRLTGTTLEARQNDRTLAVFDAIAL